MGQYQKVKKSYNHTIKINKRKSEIDHIKRLESLVDNPKQFWSHLKSSRGIEKSDTLNATSPKNGLNIFLKFLNQRILKAKTLNLCPI